MILVWSLFVKNICVLSHRSCKRRTVRKCGRVIVWRWRRPWSIAGEDRPWRWRFCIGGRCVPFLGWRRIACWETAGVCGLGRGRRSNNAPRLFGRFPVGFCSIFYRFIRICMYCVMRVTPRHNAMWSVWAGQGKRTKYIWRGRKPALCCINFTGRLMA